MKTLIKILSIFYILIFFNSNILVSQTDCGIPDFPSEEAPYPNDFFGGYFKPHRTDFSNGNIIPEEQNASLNMLFVFVQFQDENDSTGEWSIGQPPTFMNKFLVKDKNNSVEFWNRYRDSSLSDYYQELSRGAFHVTGEPRHLIMYHTWSYYKNTVGYNGFLTEIYSRLSEDTSIHWEKFDLWSRNDQTNNYVFSKDKYLDLMGIFIRDLIDTDFTVHEGAGYVPLFGPVDYVIYSNGNDTVKIGWDWNKYGSGFIAKGSLGPLGYNRAMGIAIHEYGHYLFYNPTTVHSTSGIMTSNGGISVNDLFMSGYEKYKLGLLDTVTANFSQQHSYSLEDISGRNNPSQSPDFPQILKVPISGTDFFIVENRRKISDWDIYMLGDTSRNDPFRPTGNYGKGIYIYHSNNIGLNYTGNVDIECADGLWNWGDFGYEHPDWSNTDNVLVKLRTALPSVITNDFGTTGFNSYSNADGISAGPWFSIGKKHSSVGFTGTDRIFTNDTNYWTSRERWGDRWDAWNIGYNEIFSPYSNPNTKTHDNSESEIFIHYNSLTNGVAIINVYKVNQPYSLDTILYYTPPSKPMGIAVDYYLEGENIMRPRITWNHNTEPDMLSDSLTKRYKIWRATYGGMTYPPTNYSLLVTLDIDSGAATSYIDTTIVALGSAWPGMGSQIEYPVRYTVQAIDKYSDSSVRSDFGSAIGLVPNIGCSNCEEGPDNFIENESTPEEYSLKQNYPNPFNPTTNIQFDLPEDNFVTIKIYDILGKEVFTLVNEFKEAGRYVVSFNGSNLPSGVYYYRIKSGGFNNVKRLVLIK